MTQTQQTLPYRRETQFDLIRAAIARLPAELRAKRNYEQTLFRIMETFILCTVRGGCWLPYEVLAAKAGVGQSTFRKYAAEAVRLGWLEKTARINHGGQQSNEFRVKLANLSSSSREQAPATEEHPAATEEHPGATEEQAFKEDIPDYKPPNESSPPPSERQPCDLVHAGGKWAQVVRRLLKLGVIGAQQAVDRAKQIGARPADVAAVCDQYESIPGAWEPRQLYQRVISTTAGSDPAANWLPFCENYRNDQAARKQVAERARLAQEAAERERTLEESRQESEQRQARLWPTLAGMSDQALRELIAATPDDRSFTRRYLQQQLARDGPGERFRRNYSIYLFDLLEQCNVR